MLRIKIIALEYIYLLTFIVIVSCDALEEASTDSTPPESVVLYESTYVTKSSVELIWTKNDNDDFHSYVIYRDSISMVTDSSLFIATIYDQDSTRYIDMNLIMNKEYFYRVYVHDKNENASGSNIISVITIDRDYALEFDGMNDYVEVLNDSSLFPIGELTLKAWVFFYPDNSPLGGILFEKYIYKGEWNGSFNQMNGYGYIFSRMTDDIVQLNVYSGTGNYDDENNSIRLYTNNPVPVNEWIHIAGVYDMDSVYIFINGAREASARYYRGIAENEVNLRIGNSYNEYGDNQHYKGKIDGIRISNITRYRNNFTPPSISDLERDEYTTGLWKFNEDVGNILFDTSGNENHGTIYGAKWVLH